MATSLEHMMVYKYENLKSRFVLENLCTKVFVFSLVSRFHVYSLFHIFHFIVFIFNFKISKSLIVYRFWKRRAPNMMKLGWTKSQRSWL